MAMQASAGIKRARACFWKHPMRFDTLSALCWHCAFVSAAIVSRLHRAVVDPSERTQERTSLGLGSPSRSL